ncbi:MAG: ParB/RepB/Spo0J family partition protein [Nocardioidaceae bacterium]|nr:ParB/RepB/Spo0J family partition protein [Nocardioidaceae bacterium]MCL2612768.1 ParB/RepB/Spo0J family partition protein [Nocardioidaceae bacterium]
MTSNAPRRGLGRGLGSLIPSAPTAPADQPDVNSPARDSDIAAGAPSGASVDPGSTAPARGAQIEDSGLTAVDGAYFAELPVDQVRPNAVNPRTVFDEDAMAELVHSVKEIGLLQPVVVRRTGPSSYELVMGERRWRATQQAGLETIPAIVRETDDTDMLRDALLENLHRSELNPLEEAAAYNQLLEDFACTHDELAQRIGRSRPQISNTLRLLRLTPAVQRRVAAGVLSAGHARALLGVADADAQDRLAQRVVAEGISVRGLEELVATSSDSEDKPQRSRRPKPQAPGLSELSDRLADRLETRVKVDLGRAKGKVTIEFANAGDLQRIVDLIDPRNRTDRVI